MYEYKNEYDLPMEYNTCKSSIITIQSFLLPPVSYSRVLASEQACCQRWNVFWLQSSMYAKALKQIPNK